MANDSRIPGGGAQPPRDPLSPRRAGRATPIAPPPPELPTGDPTASSFQSIGKEPPVGKFGGNHRFFSRVAPTFLLALGYLTETLADEFPVRDGQRASYQLLRRLFGDGRYQLMLSVSAASSRGASAVRCSDITDIPPVGGARGALRLTLTVPAAIMQDPLRFGREFHVADALFLLWRSLHEGAGHEVVVPLGQASAPTPMRAAAVHRALRAHCAATDDALGSEILRLQSGVLPKDFAAQLAAYGYTDADRIVAVLAARSAAVQVIRQAGMAAGRIDIVACDVDARSAVPVRVGFRMADTTRAALTVEQLRLLVARAVGLGRLENLGLTARHLFPELTVDLGASQALHSPVIVALQPQTTDVALGSPDWRANAVGDWDARWATAQSMLWHRLCALAAGDNSMPPVLVRDHGAALLAPLRRVVLQPIVLHRNTSGVPMHGSAKRSDALPSVRSADAMEPLHFHLGTYYRRLDLCALLETVVYEDQEAIPRQSRMKRVIRPLVPAATWAFVRLIDAYDRSNPVEHGTDFRGAVSAERCRRLADTVAELVRFARDPVNLDGPAFLKWLRQHRKIHIAEAVPARDENESITLFPRTDGLMILVRAHTEPSAAAWRTALLTAYLAGPNNCKLVLDQSMLQIEARGLLAQAIRNFARGFTSSAATHDFGASRNPQWIAARDPQVRSAYVAALRWFQLHQRDIADDCRPSPIDAPADNKSKFRRFQRAFHPDVAKTLSFDIGDANAQWDAIRALHVGDRS